MVVFPNHIRQFISAIRPLALPVWDKNLYGSDSDEYAMALYDQLLFCVKAGKAVQAADSIQSLMSVVEKNIYSRFRNEKYDLRLKKLYEKIQKM